MVLQLPNDVLFDTGKTELKPAGRASLRQVAEVLQTIRDRQFQIAGHTDDKPIHTARFPSNWELSSQRALEVTHFLIEQGVRHDSLSAAGYSDVDPVAPNGTPEGRAKNRRTEITRSAEHLRARAHPGHLRDRGMVRLNRFATRFASALASWRSWSSRTSATTSSCCRSPRVWRCSFGPWPSCGTHFGGAVS